ncbi:hypothetical protein [Sinisalibacter aestuarii]|nr:hypothetical protein [Sinisalibacter aestuarii]
MTYLLLAILLVAATAHLVRPALAATHQLSVSVTDTRVLVALFPAILSVTLVFGLTFALALILALLVKEMGHVLGYRLAGHDDAQLRLLPLPGGPGISARAPANDAAALFILLMGPGFGLAPMVLAFALGAALQSTAPALADTARSYALAAGAVNFIALLPLWPLPGGRLLQLLMRARFPHLRGLVAAALTAFAIGLSLTLHSGLLFLVGLLTALALVLRPGDMQSTRPRLSRAQARTGFFAYFASIAAYFMGGWWVLQVFPALF